MPIITAKGKNPRSIRNTMSYHLGRVTLLGFLEHFFLDFLSGLGFIFYLLCLTGCLTDVARTPDLFVVSLAENVNTTNEVTIQIGYFGMCLRVPSAGPICKLTASLSTDQLLAAFLPSPVGNLTNTTATPILHAARTLQDDKILAPLLCAPVVLLVATSILSVLYRCAPHNKIPRRGLAISVWVAAAAATVSSAATTQTGAALAYATRGIHGLAVAVPSSPGDDEAVSASAVFTSRLVTRGVALEGLQWAAAAFQVLIAGYAMAIIYSARVRRRDTPEQVSAPAISRHEQAPVISRPRQSYTSSRYSQFSETHNHI